MYKALQVLRRNGKQQYLKLLEKLKLFKQF